jgi:HD-GYP domain-containing protein (c-di-GMP phosphodiesterase class II)
VRSILYNPDALTWLTRLSDCHAPTAEHSLNVCILAINFGRYIGLPREELENLGISALLHDVGMVRLPSAVLDKRDLLANEEYQVLKKHVVHGRDLLLDTPKLYVGAADVAYSHHENWDGTGYPRRLRGDQIPLFAQIVALADTYEAVVTARPYQSARSSLEALKLIHSQRGVRFDPRLALRFIECIGIYPTGAVVELENDEVGVVLAATRDKLRPRIVVVRDAEDRVIAKPKVVDLSENEVDKKGNPYRVRCVLPAGSHGVDPRDYLDEGLINKHRRTLARPIDIVL